MAGLMAELMQMFVDTLLDTLRDIAPITVMLLFFQFAILRAPLIAPMRVLRTQDGRTDADVC